MSCLQAASGITLVNRTSTSEPANSTQKFRYVYLFSGYVGQSKLAIITIPFSFEFEAVAPCYRCHFHKNLQ